MNCFFPGLSSSGLFHDTRRAVLAGNQSIGAGGKGSSVLLSPIQP